MCECVGDPISWTIPGSTYKHAYLLHVLLKQ